jgi:hypothetical protein
MQWTSQTRYGRGSADYRVNIKRQNSFLHQFSQSSKLSKILHFLSKTGITEIFRTSAAKVGIEAIPDITPHHRFHVAENFALGRMSRRNWNLYTMKNKSTDFSHKFYSPVFNWNLL